MAIFANIGGHRINPLNVFCFAETTIDSEATETVSGKSSTVTTHRPAVEIVGIGDHEDNKILIEGVTIEAIEAELNMAMNTVPSIGGV